MNILFVCLGNICRSPLAEGIMKDLYAERNLLGVIESAGTADFNIGNAADYRSIAVARENGIDISKHRARKLLKSDFERFDYIFGMDAYNIACILKTAPDENAKKKVALIAEDSEIADPYTSDIKAFRETYRLLRLHCESRILLHPKLSR